MASSIAEVSFNHIRLSLPFRRFGNQLLGEGKIRSFTSRSPHRHLTGQRAPMNTQSRPTLSATFFRSMSSRLLAGPAPQEGCHAVVDQLADRIDCNDVSPLRARLSCRYDIDGPLCARVKRLSRGAST